MNVRRRLAFTAFLAVVVVAGVVGTDRIIGWRLPDLGQDLRHYGEPERVIALRESVPLQNASAPVRYRTDQDGFLLPAPRRPDALTLAFLGGGTTECALVDETDRWPAQAAAALEGRLHQPVDPVNAGRSGNHVLDEYVVFIAKLLGRRVHVALIMPGADDLDALLANDSYWTRSGEHQLLAEPPTLADRLFATTRTLARRVVPHLYSVVRGDRAAPGAVSLEPRATPPTAVQIASARHDFSSALRLLVGSIRAHGVEPILLTEYNRFRPDDGAMRAVFEQTTGRHLQTSWEAYVSAYDAFTAVVRETAQSEQVLLIDLAGRVPADTAHIDERRQLTTAGGRLVAAEVAQALAARHASE